MGLSDLGSSVGLSISKNTPVLQAIIRAYKGLLPNHFDIRKPL